MIYKSEFDKERNECGELTHIEKDITDPTLKEIDKLYGQVDVLSMKYNDKHHSRIYKISIIAPCIVFFFLLYEALAQPLLIFVVTGLIVILYVVYREPKNEKSHEKYLEYRVVAETLRIQYFISKAGIKRNVMEILPWFTEIRIPLVKEILSELPTIETKEKKPILDCWIRDQMEYHDGKHEESLKKEERNEFYEKLSLTITILIYAIAVIFEGLMLICSPVDLETAHWIRVGFKIGVGTATVITIFLSNYYGKQSLSSKINVHLRMFWLYQKIEHKIKLTKKESEEDIIYLAKQCLIENVLWYSHENKNVPDFAVE